MSLIVKGGPFSVVYADPPWQYRHCASNSRRIEKHYPTLTHGELLRLKVQTTKDAVLFLWATAPKLVEAIEVLQAWGFDYRTNAVWDKGQIGTGYWFRTQHELLLVGAKGEMRPPPPHLRKSSVLHVKRGAHSDKPDHVPALIDQWYPNLPKIELFSRMRRNGWSAFGTEIEETLFTYKTTT